MSLKDQGCNYNKKWSQLQYTGAKAHVIKNFNKTNKNKQNLSMLAPAAPVLTQAM